MKLRWDKENDVLYFRLDDSEIYELEEIEPGAIIPFEFVCPTIQFFEGER